MSSIVLFDSHENHPHPQQNNTESLSVFDALDNIGKDNVKESVELDLNTVSGLNQVELKDKPSAMYLKGLRKKIEGKLGKNEWIEIFNIIKRDGVKYTANVNGILVEMGKMSNETVREIDRFVSFSLDNLQKFKTDKENRDIIKKQMVAHAEENPNSEIEIQTETENIKITKVKLSKEEKQMAGLVDANIGGKKKKWTETERAILKKGRDLTTV
jgi:hypothetical protein